MTCTNGIIGYTSSSAAGLATFSLFIVLCCFVLFKRLGMLRDGIRMFGLL